MRYLITATASLLTMISCTGDKPAGKTDSAGSPPAVGSNISGTTNATGDTTANAPTDKADSAAWTATEFGIGPVRAGMTVAQARAALGGALTETSSATSSAPSCGYATSSRAPKGINFMIVDGKIARADVRGGTVATAAGAKIGDTEQRVRALYVGRIAVTPHKYTNGHYLTVTPSNPADSAYRIVFETDSSRVTVYRSGLRPPVEWVEGCS